MNFSIDDLRDFSQRNLSSIALGICALILILVTVNVVLDTLDQRTIKKNDYARQNVKPLTQNSAERSIRTDLVIRANLFGNAAPVAVVAAPKTTLNLTLKGILSANSPSYARAIIQVGTKSSQLYSVGEEIKGAGAKLEEIRAHEVLLNRSGAIESLPLSKVGSTRGASISYSTRSSELSPRSASPASFSGNSPNTLRSNRAANRAANAETKADSPNGPRRKIKRPSFSGINRAIKKADDI